jgi:hypothetical protein
MTPNNRITGHSVCNYERQLLAGCQSESLKVVNCLGPLSLEDCIFLLALNMGPLAFNLGRRGRILSNNSGRKKGCLQVLWIMFAGPYSYRGIKGVVLNLILDNQA